MIDPFSSTVSVLALAVSATTAWLTLFRRGKVRMTQPTVIHFGTDTSRSRDDPAAKIYLRTLLFCTAKRGRVIESMHVSLSRNETHQNFNIWVHGEDKLMRGSGLFVGETGVALNHHFFSPGMEPYHFVAGKYRLDVFAQLVGKQQRTRLFTQYLEVSQEHAALLTKAGWGLYFDWGPDSSCYLCHIEHRPPPLEAPDMRDILASMFGKGQQEEKP